MAQPTEPDVLAALSRYRARIAEANHRAMLAIIPQIEGADPKGPDYFASVEDEEGWPVEQVHYILGIDGTLPPIERPSDVLDKWDLIVQQATLDGTWVAIDPEWRAGMREIYRSAILEGLGHLECPTGEWALPHDFQIIMQHADSLVGHGWYRLRDISEQLIIWEGMSESYEQIQQNVMTGEDILDITSGLDDSRTYDIAGGWVCGHGNESGFYIVYSRPTWDKSRGWSWRYLVSQGQFGCEIYDDIVAVLDWYSDQNEPNETDIEDAVREILDD
ncbi:hypothetical protein G7Z17_g5808 [Cylindrodendrum hubeiense]|uniref:Uncharacterized protein n=1 Tax=Cylindrodendrum hubeiense TaxID=595255 RepID=A0A9P5LBE8_9HYPO|nr:hypothetical protein G7Z17_g5808 [Cylindrodendrum hubeiense]